MDQTVQHDVQPQPQAYLAFHLTGKRSRAPLDAIEGSNLQPALFAGYRDLAALRYDFPLLLTKGGTDRKAVQSLSGLIDDLIKRLAGGGEDERLRKHALQLERELRTLAAGGVAGLLSQAWDRAAGRMREQGDERLQDSLRRLSAALDRDGDLIDCDAAAASRVCRHLWQAVHDDKARRFRARLDTLAVKLSDILRADEVRSAEGRSPERLRAEFGTTHRDTFDFSAMSRLLGEATRPAPLPAARRQRIEWLLSVLTSQRFFAAESTGAEGAYDFVFDNPADAIAAYRERLPKAVEVAMALAMAELEVTGEYDEARYGPVFAAFGADNLDPADLDLLPDYLICVRATEMRAAEFDMLLEAWAAGMRAKLLVQTGDILQPSHFNGGNVAFGWRPNQLARSVVDLNAFYVVQTASSSLYRLRDAIHRGIEFPGSALFSVYVGGENPDVPAYLAAAAATESRAFPTFVFDPSAGPDWASRFRLDDNPQVERDWPVRSISYEDDAHQRLSETLAFTLVDFVACDPRYRKHFARVPRANWTSGMVPVTEFLGRQADAAADKVPYLLMVDGQNRLQRVLVDERVVREARRCADIWRSLQELGGIHNSHAARLLAQERELWEQQHAQAVASAAVAAPGEPAAPAAPAAAAAAAATPAAEAPEPAKSSDDAYIETPRCTTCNECTQINDKMFAYDANKQAYIADPDAGTYRQLVEAAESCQVAIIHPGKPRNPKEPGLDELMQRAEAFP